jgi:hypothetical protein
LKLDFSERPGGDVLYRFILEQRDQDRHGSRVFEIAKQVSGVIMVSRNLPIHRISSVARPPNALSLWPIGFVLENCT